MRSPISDVNSSLYRFELRNYWICFQIFSVLDTSDQGNTIVTTGDLNYLVSLDKTNDYDSMILDRKCSSSINDSKTITPGSCVASPPLQSNLKTQDIYQLYCQALVPVQSSPVQVEGLGLSLWSLLPTTTTTTTTTANSSKNLLNGICIQSRVKRFCLIL